VGPDLAKFRPKIGKKWVFLTQNKAKLCKNLIIKLFFFIVTENYNIDPSVTRLGEFSPAWQLFTLGGFLQTTEITQNVIFTIKVMF
jgi:hypothetical protein